MDKLEVIREAKRLPVESRRDIAKAIVDSIDRDLTAASAEARLAQLLPLACAALDVTDYNPKRKSNGDAYARSLCAYVMRHEGYTLSQVGRAMGRNTSSVVVMARRGDEMKTGYFGHDIKERFARFEETIKDKRYD